jgi:diadenosine tetraphosphatase ApaH/serine/threonine PP2A family protein phosphatase
MADTAVALVSDIHANWRALEAVHKDIRRELGADATIFSLGDVVGYGPKPLECAEWVMKYAEWSLLGNHDAAVMFDPEHFNEAAERAILWTRTVIERSRASDVLFEWFGTELPKKQECLGALFVHGSPRNPVNEYVRPEDIYDERKMSAIAAKISGLAFCGHTHLPGVFDLSGTPQFYEASLMDATFDLRPLRTALVNVGSVGQPRDGDPRACYVIFDPNERTVRFQRVEYDVDRAIKDFEGLTELEPYFATRLRTGR